MKLWVISLTGKVTSPDFTRLDREEKARCALRWSSGLGFSLRTEQQQMRFISHSFS
jgi:hypothetical protein